MTKIRSVSLAALALAACVTPAAAHFQMVHAGPANRPPGQPAEMLLVFTHPFTGGPSMEMGPPEEFYLVHQRGEAEAERVDLTGYLEEIEWTDADHDNVVTAYRASIPGSEMRSMGDYTFVLKPAPYLETEEDVYIQQITKAVFNVGGVPGNWDQPLGLPAEILPLGKPYANWTGGVFRGVVLSQGEPVPFAEIEVEYVNRALDAEAHGWSGEPAIEAPVSPLEILSIRADANGTFTVGLPKAGWWGIGALGVGPQTEFNGKELSQDAVIWVEVTDIPG